MGFALAGADHGDWVSVLQIIERQTDYDSCDCLLEHFIRKPFVCLSIDLSFYACSCVAVLSFTCMRAVCDSCYQVAVLLNLPGY